MYHHLDAEDIETKVSANATFRFGRPSHSAFEPRKQRATAWAHLVSYNFLGLDWTATTVIMAQPVCHFEDRLTHALNAASPGGAEVTHTHSHDNIGPGHSHDHLAGTWTPEEHGHSHEHLEHAGLYIPCYAMQEMLTDHREILRARLA